MSTDRTQRSEFEQPFEQANAYFVEVRYHSEEQKRVHLQDQLITAGMGGVFPEQPDPTRFQSVMDVSCGTGGWLIKAAQTYPNITRLVGVDISQTMLNFAREQAQAAHVEDRVEFRMLDVLQSFDFGSEQFDLVNQRFAKGHLHTWDWPKLFPALQKVLRPGGIIRITEPNGMECKSPAFDRLDMLLNQAFFKSGRQFSPERTEFVPNIEPFMRESGLQNIQTHVYRLEFHQGTPEGDQFAVDMQHFYRNIETFLRKFTTVPDNYDEIYQQMLLEMQEPGFMITWPFLTVWGTRE